MWYALLKCFKSCIWWRTHVFKYLIVFLPRETSKMVQLSSCVLVTISMLLCLFSSQDLSSFTITTDSINPGDGSLLNIRIYWNTNQYECIFSPTSVQTNTSFTCNSTTWTQSNITANQYIQYYVQLTYSTSELIQFASVRLVDTTDSTYDITDFCIRWVLLYNYIRNVIALHASDLIFV